MCTVHTKIRQDSHRIMNNELSDHPLMINNDINEGGLRYQQSRETFFDSAAVHVTVHSCTHWSTGLTGTLAEEYLPLLSADITALGIILPVLAVLLLSAPLYSH
jgi:hypothetical protein